MTLTYLILTLIFVILLVWDMRMMRQRQPRFGRLQVMTAGVLLVAFGCLNLW